MKRLWSDPEFRERITAASRKATQTPEYRKNRSRIAKEVASRPEWKRKQSLAHKGKKRPPEVGRKISKSKMGHTVSDETRKKLADAARGSKSFFYKGGVSNMRQLFYSSWEWKAQSERIRKRDDYICQGCGWNQDDMKRANAKKGLPVHHVIPLEEWDGEPSEYPDFLLSTMCPNCHSKSDNHKGAMKWPRNSRGDKAKPEKLENPRERQTSLDEFQV
jgi:5-methylcytosine-specific restriction endonuclease McrA